MSLAAGLVLLSGIAVAAASRPDAAQPVVSAVTRVDGIAIAVAVQSSGSDRSVELKLTDAATGAPLRDAEPVGWLYPEDRTLACPAVIAKAANGAIGTAAINLNSVRIAAAFADGSLGMIDPQTSFAGTQLESAFDLAAPARALAVSPDGDRLAVVTQAGRLRLIDASGALSQVTEQEVSPDAAIAWAGDRLLVAGGSGLPIYAADGAMLSKRAWRFAGQPILRASPEGGVIVGSAAGPVGLAPSADGLPAALSSIEGLRDAVWLGKSAAWAIATTGGSLSMVRAGAEPEAVAGLAGVRAVATDEEGRFVLAIVDDGANLALIDSADRRVLDRRPLENPADRITASRDFAYVHSPGSAEVELISFEVIRQQHRIATVDLPFGAERPASEPPFARIGIMPGGAAVIGQDGRTLFAYAEGMMVPMGSFAGVTRPLAGIAVLDHSLREITPGVYRTNAEVRFGGAYRLPLRLGNPRIDTCLTLELPGPPRLAQTPARQARFDRNAWKTSPGQALPVVLDAPVQAETIIALATDMVGQWQRHFTMRRTANGQYSGAVRFPVPGAYRLVALNARADVIVSNEKGE